MFLVDRAFAADRRGYRRRESLRKLEEFLLGAGDHNTAAAEKNWTRRVAQQLAREIDEDGIGRNTLGRIPPQSRIAPDVGPINRAVLHVERKSDVGRAWPTRGHLFESGTEDTRD